MTTFITLDGIQAMMAQQTGLIFTHIIEFSHDFLGSPKRFVANNEDLDLAGYSWTAKAFEVTLPADKGEAVPVMTVTFDNIDSELVTLFRSVTGEIIVRYAIVSINGDNEAATERAFLTLEVTQVKYTATEIIIYLSYAKDYLNDPAVKDSFNPATFPGLFS